MKEAYFVAVCDGATVVKNKITLCTINGVIKRYQVYSERAGKDFSEVFYELDSAVDKFVELSS